MPDRLTVTVEEAAELLGVSRAFAYALVKKRELPYVRLGRRVVVPRIALERLLGVEGEDGASAGPASAPEEPSSRISPT